jgi:calcium-dependent protein kinase
LQQIKYGAKTDIWSIGLMFYEMLFANTPWACKNVETYVRGMKTQPYINFPYKQSISD